MTTSPRLASYSDLFTDSLVCRFISLLSPGFVSTDRTPRLDSFNQGPNRVERNRAQSWIHRMGRQDIRTRCCYGYTSPPTRRYVTFKLFPKILESPLTPLSFPPHSGSLHPHQHPPIAHAHRDRQRRLWYHYQPCEPFSHVWWKFGRRGRVDWIQRKSDWSWI